MLHFSQTLNHVYLINGVGEVLSYQDRATKLELPKLAAGIYILKSDEVMEKIVVE